MNLLRTILDHEKVMKISKINVKKVLKNEPFFKAISTVRFIEFIALGIVFIVQSIRALINSLNARGVTLSYMVIETHLLGQAGAGP